MGINELLKDIVEKKADGLHLSPGAPPMFNIKGKIGASGEERLCREDLETVAGSLMNDFQKGMLARENSVDFTFGAAGNRRFRANIFRQKGMLGAVIKLVPDRLPTIKQLGLPPVVERLARSRQGLILVTGASGCGKTATLAAMVNAINQRRKCHIILLEDPIEYSHEHSCSIISQREVGTDSYSFAQALREAIRQDADVICVGDMREAETISTALVAAETGHLVMGTMHTADTISAIDRIVDAFPAEQAAQVRTQLASVLRAVLAQQLLIRADGTGRIPVVEVLIGTQAVKSLIREEKVHHIRSIIETSRDAGMQTFDQALEEIYEKGLIEFSEAFKVSGKYRKIISRMDATAVPASGQEGGIVYHDLGPELPDINPKDVIYRTRFEQESLPCWSSSGILEIAFEGLKSVYNPVSGARSSYVTDFSMVSGRSEPFKIPKHLAVRFCLEPLDEQKKDIRNYFHIEAQADRKVSIPYVSETVPGIPVAMDGAWHCVMLTMPEEIIGQDVRIYTLEFLQPFAAALISDIIFFI